MSLFAAPTRLNRLQIEITTGCNLRCAGCQRTLGMNSGDWVNRHMAVEDFARVVANAPQANYVVLQGIGEPTLHPRLDDLITIARDSGKFGGVSFNTNALAREVEDFARWKALGLGHISISVDSLNPPVAERVRAGTDTNRLRLAVARLIPLFEGRVTLSVVVSRGNLGELRGLLGELAALGAPTVEIQPLVAYGAESRPLALSGEDRDAVRAAVAETQSRHPRMTVAMAPILTPNGSRCRRPFRAAYVTVEGMLTPCCLTEDASLYGHASLLEQSFAQAWDGPGVSGWLDRYLDATPEICKGCCYNPSGRDEATALDEAQAMQSAWNVFQNGQPEAAEAALRRLLTDGQTPEALHRVGLTWLRRQKPADALPWLEAAARLNATPPLVNNLASALAATGQKDKARDLLINLLNRHGDYEPGYRALVGLMLQTGRSKDAAAALFRLVRRAVEGNNRPLVERHLDQLSSLSEDIDNLLLLGNMLRGAGWPDLGTRLLDVVCRRWPQHLGARLTACMALLPQGYETPEQMAEVRRRYGESLALLVQAAETATRDSLAAALPQIGQAKPFFLAYQGEDDRALQELYGRVVSRIAQATERPRPALVGRPEPGERLRVGFAGSYFRLHSVSKLFSGWIRRLDKAGFELFAYDLSGRPAGATADFAPDDWARGQYEACDTVTAGLSGDDAWIEAIAKDRLHALIYFELGMDPAAVRLACRRLAPVQCVTWGHPVTTGLPTIDYFLSSDLMEPAGAAVHYSEKLIRLPNLSIHYQPLPQGQGFENGRLSRPGMGLRDDALVFICCQSLFKYRPQEDDLFVRIAARLPQAQFLFLGIAGLARTELFRCRLASAFAQAGLPFDRHVVIAEPVAPVLFPSFLALGDVYLDSLSWSGGNTSLEAATAGIPIITAAGPLMRGRHTAAILRHLGLTEWIAQDLDGLAALAERLADSGQRARAAALMAERRPWLFGDDTPVRALEDFLRRAAGSIMTAS
ncbi:MAG TPA: radical SAM protein [Candidatus Sulfotelmatobacter sp.]|jgi:predicted O-linked N-acetylglucosamine transferase (SPINDLY family)/MoaA/NifB/PqqE/SkfB family radical SAM enzyme|nr:radical SAM protein [Candidatus Sulfotelmatobacter sp.]